jgi:hypothetical protein
MSSIANQDKLPLSPRLQLIHIQQLPDLDRRRLDFADQSLESRVEVLIHLQDLLDRTLFVPFCKVLAPFSRIRDGQPTVALGRVGFCVWVDADKVEQFVVVAGIHDYPSVLRVPHQECVLVLDQCLGSWVRLGNCAGDQEAKGGFA